MHLIYIYMYIYIYWKQKPFHMISYYTGLQLFKYVKDWDVGIKTDKSIFTHPSLVPHICDSESGQHWIRWWFVAFSTPAHYLSKCLFFMSIFMNETHLKISSAKWWPFGQGGGGGGGGGVTQYMAAIRFCMISYLHKLDWKQCHYTHKTS